jgi:hypothetical protein
MHFLTFHLRQCGGRPRRNLYRNSRPVDRCPLVAPLTAAAAYRPAIIYTNHGRYLQEQGLHRIYNRVPGKGRKELWGPAAGLPACAARTPPLGGWVGNKFVVCCYRH